MLRIGDFSRLSRVTVKTLRYYDEIGLLKPVRVDEFTGYRYYSAEQLPRLYRIVILKGLGLTLDEITDLIDNDLPVDNIVRLLHVKQAEIRERLGEDERRLAQVEEWLDEIKKEGVMPDTSVILKKIDSQTIASVRDVISSYAAVGELWDEICSYLIKQRAQFAGPPVAIYYDPEYRERDVDVEAAVPIIGTIAATDRIKTRTLPAEGRVACLIHRGPYEKMSESYRALMAWAEKNGYQIAGPNREVYLEGPGEGRRPADYVTEIQVPVVHR